MILKNLLFTVDVSLLFCKWNQTSTTLLMTARCNKLKDNRINKFVKHNKLHLFYCHFIKKLNPFNRGLSLTVSPQARAQSKGI